MLFQHLTGWGVSALYFIAVLSVLVIAHEWGHYITAKIFGMRVEDFSLFFGKPLIKLGERHGTEYFIRSIPLGGFVKIKGMEPEDAFSISVLSPNHISEKQLKKRPRLLNGLTEESFSHLDTSTVSDKVRTLVWYSVGLDNKLISEGLADLNSLLSSPSVAEADHKYIQTILEADAVLPDPQSFNQKPLWQRALVIFAGPFMSVFFGYLVLTVMGFTTGLPNDVQILPKIGPLLKGKPAQMAGLQSGDTVIQIDGKKVTSGDQMVNLIHESMGKPLHMLVSRDRRIIPFTVTPYAALDQAFNDNGNPEMGKNGKPVMKMEGHLGFSIVSSMIFKRYSPLVSVQRGSVIIYRLIKAMLGGIFSTHVRQNVGGPIAIAGAIHQAQKQGLADILLLAAGLSISLGVINLFPIPILDGGHLLLLSIEGARRRKLSAREMSAAQILGLGVIGVLFLLVMYNDILNLVTKSK